MPYTKEQKDATIRYIKKRQHQIVIRYKEDEFEHEICPAIRKSNMKTATFIKRAVREKIERDGLNKEIKGK